MLGLSAPGRQLAHLAKTGVLKPVIDRRHKFAEMADAHAFVETARKRGSVVASVAHASLRYAA